MGRKKSHAGPVTQDEIAYIRQAFAPIPQDPKPTHDELCAIIGQHRELNETERALAILRWKENKLRQDPNAFLVPRAPWRPDFHYTDYLQSAQWKAIRERKLQSVNHRCETGCGHRAIDVHHRDYRPRVLAGDDTSALVALCRECHTVIEFEYAPVMPGSSVMGWTQRRSWQNKERTLFKLTLIHKRKRDHENDPKVKRRRALQKKYRQRKQRERDKAKLKAWTAERAAKTPYALGREDAISHTAAIDTYGAAPDDQCPFKRGTPEEAEYDHGWKDQMND
jgi:hypothetical protein